jgi:hypothetical protein
LQFDTSVIGARLQGSYSLRGVLVSYTQDIHETEARALLLCPRVALALAYTHLLFGTSNVEEAAVLEDLEQWQEPGGYEQASGWREDIIHTCLA